MTAESQRIIRWCVETEIAAVEADLKRRPAHKDFAGQRYIADVRDKHLSLLRSALYEVNREKVAGT